MVFGSGWNDVSKDGNGCRVSESGRCEQEGRPESSPDWAEHSGDAEGVYCDRLVSLPCFVEAVEFGRGRRIAGLSVPGVWNYVGLSVGNPHPVCRLPPAR